jgi:acetyl-CoA carboxylase biotin carboxyl carrier protein
VEVFELTEQDVFRLVEMFGSSDVTFMQVKVGDIEVILARGDHAVPPSMDSGAASPPPAAARPVPATTPVTTPTVAVAPSADVQPTDLVTISAPTLGTFYCASRPDLPPYVQVGSVVDTESTVGLIEAMKVFTGVSAGVNGSVVEILVENGDFVEFGQPLFRVKPQASDSDSAQ